MFVFFILVFLLLCFGLFSQWKFFRLSWTIPNAGGIPFIGLASKISKIDEILPLFGNVLEKFGKVVFFWLGPFPSVLVNDADVAEIVFTSKACLDKAAIYKPVGKYIGDGLFSLPGAEWQRHRKLINPSFHQKILLNFLPVFNQGADCINKDLGKLVGKKATDFSHLFHKTSLNVAAETTMGRKMSEEGETDLLPFYQTILSFGIVVIMQPWLQIDFIFKMWKHYEKTLNAVELISKFSQSLIESKIEELNSKDNRELEEEQQNTKKNSIFINQTLSLVQKNEFNWKEVEAESNVMIFGAFETTATVLYSVLMCLSFYPEYQERVFEEIMSVIPDEGDITYEHIKELTFMEMVINETLRLLPAVPIVGRRVAEDMYLTKDILVPQDTQIIISIFHIQRNEKYWGKNACVFNPDNFLPENVNSRNPFAFLPFTKGLRNCIGRQYAYFSLKVILSKMIRKYRFSTEDKFEELEYIEAVTLKFKNVPKIEVNLR